MTAAYHLLHHKKHREHPAATPLHHNQTSSLVVCLQLITANRHSVCCEHTSHTYFNTNYQANASRLSWHPLSCDARSPCHNWSTIFAFASMARPLTANASLKHFQILAFLSSKTSLVIGYSDDPAYLQFQ